MADNKLLEEQAIRKFMKIAGTSGLSDTFVKTQKKNLKEENRGERTMDPHEEDPRHENLKEEEDVKEGEELEEELAEEGEVQEESKEDSGQSGKKRIASGTPLKGAGKPGKLQYEAKEDSGQSGKKRIASGTPVKGAGKPGKLQYEEKTEDGEKLDEFGPPGSDGDDEEVELGAGGEQSPMGEPDMGSEMGAEPSTGMGDGGLDISALVTAIAKAIETSTGVKIAVEGGAGDGDGDMDDAEMEPPMDEPEGDVPPTDETEPQLEEDGMVGYKSQDPAVKLPSGQVRESKKGAQGGKQVAAKIASKQTAKKTPKEQIIEAVTKNVLAKLADLSKKRTEQVAKPKEKTQASAKK